MYFINYFKDIHIYEIFFTFEIIINNSYDLNYILKIKINICAVNLINPISFNNN